MKRGFLITSDAVLALLIISFAVVISNQLFINSPSFKRSGLQAIVSDAAMLIEYSELNDIHGIVNLVSDNVCLIVEVKDYDGLVLVGDNQFKTSGCPAVVRGDVVIARRTFIDDYFHVIIVKGSYSGDL